MHPLQVCATVTKRAMIASRDVVVKVRYERTLRALRAGRRRRLAYRLTENKPAAARLRCAQERCAPYARYRATLVCQYRLRNAGRIARSGAYFLN